MSKNIALSVKLLFSYLTNLYTPQRANTFAFEWINDCCIIIF